MSIFANSMMKIAILNGPNLNLLGKREPEIYGNKDFDQYFAQLQSLFPEINLTYYQSNVEGELINELQCLFSHWLPLGFCAKAMKNSW